MSNKLLEKRKDIFETWIRMQIDNWICEYESWDMMFEDGDLDDEDWEFIRQNLKVSDIVIEEVE